MYYLYKYATCIIILYTITSFAVENTKIIENNTLFYVFKLTLSL